MPDKTQLSIWTYPWDVADRGLSETLAEVADLGLNTISLATSYHAGRFVQPRGIRRKSYYPEDGTVYYRPAPDLWGDESIQPKCAAQVAEDGDMLRALVEKRASSGLRTSCWTVCLHNTRLGMLHPGHVSRNAFGDPSYFSLCPSSPAARSYARTLVKDISHNCRPDMIELETASFMGFTHGYHHEKDAVPLTPEEDFFMSLCFCGHCRKRAAGDGIDIEAARRWVQGELGKAFERERPERTVADFPQRGLEAFASIAPLYPFLLWRMEVVTSLVGEIRQAAHPDTRIVVISDSATWYAGLDLVKAAAACDGLLLCLYGEPVETVAGIAGMRRSIGPDKFLGTGFRLFYPETPGPDHLAELCRTAVAAGADGINFYNFGLTPTPRLAWIRAATRGL